MTMQDLHSSVSALNSLAPQTITISAINTGDVDLFGFESAQIIVLPGTIDGLGSGSPTGGTIATKIEHADDDGTGSAGSYSNVADSDLIGATQTAGVVDTLSESNTDKFECGYKGEKRFIRVTLTPSGLGSGGPVAVVVVKGHPRHAPAKDTQI